MRCLNDGHDFTNTPVQIPVSRDPTTGVYTLDPRIFCSSPCARYWLRRDMAVTTEQLALFNLYCMERLKQEDKILALTAPDPRVLSVYHVNGEGITIEEYRDFQHSHKLAVRAEPPVDWDAKQNSKVYDRTRSAQGSFRVPPVVPTVFLPKDQVQHVEQFTVPISAGVRPESGYAEIMLNDEPATKKGKTHKTHTAEENKICSEAECEDELEARETFAIDEVDNEMGEEAIENTSMDMGSVDVDMELMPPPSPREPRH